MRQLRTAGAEIAGGVYNNITSLQRTGLGYASYDQYYGPDDRAKSAAASRPARGQREDPSGPFPAPGRGPVRRRRERRQAHGHDA